VVGARPALRAAPDFDMLPALTRGLPECTVMAPIGGNRSTTPRCRSKKVGVIFRDDIAQADWRRAGADVRGDRLYLDRGLVRELISSIPSAWSDRPRNPERSLPFGGKHSTHNQGAYQAMITDLMSRHTNGEPILY
jgi:trimethylamine--corrinoid protein Co-methyltransferase